MCLAIPGKVLAVEKVEGIRLARVQFGGIVRAVSLDLVPGGARERHVAYALSNSFGFGGTNASVVFKRLDV